MLLLQFYYPHFLAYLREYISCYLFKKLYYEDSKVIIISLEVRSIISKVFITF